MVEHIQLKRGDNDNAKTWGGKTLDITPNYTVKELQSDLKSVGTYTMTENGVFGPKTERALKLFQWVSINMTHCLKSKKYSSRIKSSNILTSGNLDQSTYTELANWIEADKEVTGDLIRIDFSDLSNCEASPNFKKTSSSKILKNEMVISKSALELVTNINSKAKNKKITIKINQAFRENKIKVSGAVVTPAKKSQHLIGHALDCNIVDGNNWNNSTAFKNKTETDKAKELITILKGLNYRWGGDFIPVDTPHFDKKIDPNTFAYEAKFFLNQRMISLSHEVRKEKIL
jgi:uncharacterized protein YcbK (DUF882 family)